ncbi:MAG: hypothetical protein U5L01_00860 [Rheinheimera sp.]|nr:hypothetical protein [Rheinheimera sp.]
MFIKLTFTSVAGMLAKEGPAPFDIPAGLKQAYAVRKNTKVIFMPT